MKLKELADMPPFKTGVNFLKFMYDIYRRNTGMSFSKFKKYKRIIVSGPQRSGTTVMVNMIAHDTGYKVIEEDEYDWHNEALFEEMLTGNTNIVIHAPAMAHILQKFSSPENLIVFMRRNTSDIIKSQDKLGWTEQEQPVELKKYGLTTGIISEVKYEYWDNHQKSNVLNYVDIDYDELRKHYLWVNPEKRTHFGNKQVRIG